MKSNYAAWHIPSIDIGALSSFERLKHLLRYAVIAPSAHNVQPWKFIINTEAQTIAVLLDESRPLAQSDKHRRQTYMSLGAAIENLCVAAHAYGAQCKVKYTKNKQRVATLHITWPEILPQPDKTALQPLLHRQTNRGSFAKEKVSKAVIASFTAISAAGVTVYSAATPTIKKKVAEVAREAALLLMDSNFKQELSEWVRHNWTDEYTGMPASVQGIPGPISLAAKFIISKAPIEKDQSKKDAAQIVAAPLLIAICTSEDDLRHWLEAGRVFERVYLIATKNNLAVSAYASVVESPKSREKMQKIIGTSEHPVALLRVGNAKKQMPRTPRLPVEEVLTKD